MARQASSKPESSNATATIGFENGGQPSGARQTAKGSPRGERGGVHQFYTPSCVVRCLVELLAPYTAMRGKSFYQSEASLQAVNEAKDNGRIYGPTRGGGGMFASCRRSCGMRFVRRRLASARSSIVQTARFVENHHGNAIVPMNTFRRVLEHGRYAALTLNPRWP